MKIRKHFLMEEPVIDYLETFRSKNFLKTQTEALTKIIHEHQEKRDSEFSKMLVECLSAEITEKLLSAFESEYKFRNTLTRIRLGTNNADRNSEVILLLLNTLMYYSEREALFEDDSIQLEEAKRIVKERIANFKARSAEKNRDEK